MYDLNGKVAFVAGAGSVAQGWGNGRATAVLLARQGAIVFGSDYDATALAGTSDAMRHEGLSDWTGYMADMTSSASVKLAVQACIERYGRIDILINNIGGSVPGTPVTLTEEEWNAQMDRNLKTVFLACKHVIPVMERQFHDTGAGGSIVNVSATASKNFPVGGRVHVAYAAAKAGVEGFSRATAIAYAHQGIRVNAVVAGMLNTPLVAHRLARQLNAGSADDLVRQRNQLIPLGRMGDGWDIAHAILFLVSDEASYITATELVVDGGVTASRLSPERPMHSARTTQTASLSTN